MKKLIICVTSLCLLMAAGTAVIVSKVMKPAAKASKEETAIQ